MTGFSDVDSVEMLRVEGGEKSFVGAFVAGLVRSMPLLGLLFGGAGQPKRGVL
jgi:hypothetical protein